MLSTCLAQVLHFNTFSMNKGTSTQSNMCSYAWSMIFFTSHTGDCGLFLINSTAKKLDHVCFTLLIEFGNHMPRKNRPSKLYKQNTITEFG